MEENKGKTPSDRYFYLLAFRIAADLGITIAVPALIAAYLGVKFDAWQESGPWGLIIALVIAFALTAYII
ncbi:MAG: AtpZ/AtpI family protein, partial [Patescibacteria group bacterium]